MKLRDGALLIAMVALIPLLALAGPEAGQAVAQAELAAGAALARDGVHGVEAVRGAPVMAPADAWNVELVGQIGGATYAVAVQGDYAYIGVGPHLVILNTSDLAHPAVMGQTGLLPDTIKDVVVAGSYACVAASSM